MAERPDHNSLGKLIHPTAAGRAAFWRWFGRSRAVDAQGRPLVFYHGTPQGFTAFDPKHGGQGSLALDARGALFFTDSPQVANDFAGYVWRALDGAVVQVPLTGASILPVYLKMERPEVWDMGGGAYAEGFQTQALRDARRAGADSVVFSKVRDGSVFTTGQWKLSNVAVVFKASQVKSATGNSGKFSPRSNQMANPVEPHAPAGSCWKRCDVAAVTFNFMRNTQKAPPPPPGDPYGQKIEPAGVYLLRREGRAPEGWVTGRASFANPVFVPYGASSRDWKERLSAAFGGKRGKALSTALLRAGHDAIITVEQYRGRESWSEIIALKPAASLRFDAETQKNPVERKRSARGVWLHGGGDFDAFDPGLRGRMSGNEFGSRRAAFLTKSPAVARFYAQRYEDQTGEPGVISRWRVTSPPRLLNGAAFSYNDDALKAADDAGLDGVIWPQGNETEDSPTLALFAPSYHLERIVATRRNPAARYPVMSYSAAHRWEAEAKRQGVSAVARSQRGFMRAYQRAGSWAKLPEAWKRRRDAFVARHMAQVRQGSERLWKDGKPSRRALALIMWAYMPPRGNPNIDTDSALRAQAQAQWQKVLAALRKGAVRFRRVDGRKSVVIPLVAQIARRGSKPRRVAYSVELTYGPLREEARGLSGWYFQHATRSRREPRIVLVLGRTGEAPAAKDVLADVLSQEAQAARVFAHEFFHLRNDFVSFGETYEDTAAILHDEGRKAYLNTSEEAYAHVMDRLYEHERQFHEMVAGRSAEEALHLLRHIETPSYIVRSVLSSVGGLEGKWKKKAVARIAAYAERLREQYQALAAAGKKVPKTLRRNPGVLRPGTGYFAKHGARTAALKHAQKELHERTGQWLTLDEVDALMQEAAREIEAEELKAKHAAFRVVGGRRANPQRKARR